MFDNDLNDKLLFIKYVSQKYKQGQILNSSDLSNKEAHTLRLKNIDK